MGRMLLKDCRKEASSHDDPGTDGGRFGTGSPSTSVLVASGVVIASHLLSTI